MSESLMYGNEIDRAMIKRSGNLKEDVRIFLRKMISQERFYNVKVDCIQKNTGISAERPKTSAMGD